MKRRKMICILVSALIGVAGCGQESAATARDASSASNEASVDIEVDETSVEVEAETEEAVIPYIEAVVNEDGNIVIDTEQITKKASYINYPVGDVTIQLIVVRASDDTIRIAFNTCQSCNPAPMAYFVQEGDSFICQNCGSSFSTAQVGVERGGCNPAPVDAEMTQDGTLVIDSAYLQQYQGNFVSWQGPTE